MKNNEKGLQKLTELKNVHDLFKLEQITKQDFEPLTEDEINLFYKILNEKMNSLKSVEHDKFLKQIEPIISEQTKNEIWESNHIKITWAISEFMNEYGRMPTRTQIANKAELSRQTIHKHLKEYASNPLYLEQTEQFRFMIDRVLAMVFKSARNGDIRAAKLFFDIVGSPSQQVAGNTLINNQNNYIQINGMVLNQETIKNLKPEQLTQIEGIIKGALPGPEIITD
jgi:hypothetical protein